jgi:7-cyano-7-deazaguanine synthase
MSKKAICLLSGGLDSTVSTYFALNKGYDIRTLTIKYGQQHDREIQCAEKINQILKIKCHKRINIDLSHLESSSLIKSSNKKIEHNTLTDIGNTIPLTYVPARNIIFLSLALSWAESQECEVIYIGVNTVDYSGYPDCRSEFIKAFQSMANLGTKQGINGKSFEIKTPLIDKTKKEIIQLGKQLGVPFQHTWSCYQGDQKACGRCDSCQLRLKGFSDAKLKDPLHYENYPGWYKPLSID